MPARAAFSADDVTWRHTDPGRREGDRITYEVIGDGGPLWVAWGPPFTPRDTDELIVQAGMISPAVTPIELARTRGGRPVRGLRVSEAAGPAPAAIWIQARQHAWESGSSWVARGLVEWLVSDDADARRLRQHAEVFVVPIMDVDNVATGDGGKEADPRDHNRDWDDKPVYPEVAAAQDRLRELAKSGRLDLFLDLHNPAAGDARPFFFVGPSEMLPGPARSLRDPFPRTGPGPHQRPARARRGAARHRPGLSSPLAADQRPVGVRPRQPAYRRRLPGNVLEYPAQHDRRLSHGGAAAGTGGGGLHAKPGGAALTRGPAARQPTSRAGGRQRGHRPVNTRLSYAPTSRGVP